MRSITPINCNSLTSPCRETETKSRKRALKLIKASMTLSAKSSLTKMLFAMAAHPADTMTKKMPLFSPLLVESVEENVRAQLEAKLTRLPFWWYPCASVCIVIPIVTLFLIIALWQRRYPLQSTRSRLHKPSTRASRTLWHSALWQTMLWHTSGRSSPWFSSSCSALRFLLCKLLIINDLRRRAPR